MDLYIKTLIKYLKKKRSKMGLSSQLLPKPQKIPVSKYSVSYSPK